MMRAMAKLVLANGLLIDGTGRPPEPGFGIVLDGARIHDVGPMGSLSIPAGAEVVDVGGRCLIDRKSTRLNSSH